MKTVTRAGSEDLAKVVVDCRFDDCAGGAKTALIVADSAGGFRARTSQDKPQACGLRTRTPRGGIVRFSEHADSLASENASRLAAMQRADKNIDELLEDLNRTFHRLRQNGIDEELFDIVSGFEALSIEKNDAHWYRPKVGFGYPASSPVVHTA